MKMNEDIKEILDNVKKCCDIDKDASFVVYQKQDIVKLLNYITNLQEENQKLVKVIGKINKCMKKYAKTSVDDEKTIIEFYKQLENILNKLTELKGGSDE